MTEREDEGMRAIRVDGRVKVEGWGDDEWVVKASTATW